MRFDVPAEYAFAFLADPSTAPVIDPAVREYRPDSLPMRHGTRNLIRFRMWGIPVRVTSVVREWEQGRRMVMENVKPSWPVRAVATHSFAPDGEACTYTWAMEFRCSGPIGAVVGRASLASCSRMHGLNRFDSAKKSNNASSTRATPAVEEAPSLEVQCEATRHVCGSATRAAGTTGSTR